MKSNVLVIFLLLQQNPQHPQVGEGMVYCSSQFVRVSIYGQLVLSREDLTVGHHRQETVHGRQAGSSSWLTAFPFHFIWATACWLLQPEPRTELLFSVTH